MKNRLPEIEKDLGEVNDNELKDSEIKTMRK